MPSSTNRISRLSSTTSFSTSSLFILLRHVHPDQESATKAQRLSPSLREPPRVMVGIIHVELACPPTLVYGTFMNGLGRIRISWCLQPARSELVKERVNIIGRDANCLTELPVAAMAGQDELAPIARENAERRIVEFVIATHMLKIEHARVEGERSFHVAASNGWNDCHKFPFKTLLGVKQ